MYLGFIQAYSINKGGVVPGAPLTYFNDGGGGGGGCPRLYLGFIQAYSINKGGVVPGVPLTYFNDGGGGGVSEIVFRFYTGLQYKQGRCCPRGPTHIF